jgi:hypothetical protein
MIGAVLAHYRIAGAGRHGCRFSSISIVAVFPL